ncbi:non-structural maintenance of chromosomes element 4 homolog A-like [Ptychodera flava]|uniref:non-structural maintenance of chromosomes element 4 homolog A-like n=1 Tax=Ptychodera flava TaxID=63121 RepID=UPI00396A3756
MDLLSERRDIRHQYRNLITDTQKKRLDLIKPQSTGLGEALDEANRLFLKVKDSTATREAALDSQFLVLAASLGNQQAHQLQTDFVVFEPTEFVEKVVTFMSGRQIDFEGNDQQERRIPKGSWVKLGREVMPLFRRVPAFHFMLGSFERGEVTKTKRTANRKRMSDKELGPKVKPQQLAKLEKNQKEVTTEEVEKLLSILKQVTQNTDDSNGSVSTYPINFFEFIVNPESFSQTIENMFHLSFLVKDGHATVYLDEDGLPVVAPREPYRDGQTQERVEKKQVMVSLDKDQWMEVKRVFEIDRPIIPTRSSEPVQSNGYHDSSDDESD